MEQTSSEYDYLNMIKDPELIRQITREEPILFSDKIIKKNRFGFNQERNLIITNKALYNLKKKDLKRRILLNMIRGITISSFSAVLRRLNTSLVIQLQTNFGSLYSLQTASK